MNKIFDFAEEEEEEEDVIATSGNQHNLGDITEEIKDEARKLASSSKGLDIETFQRKHKIHILNVNELLKG